MQPLDQLLAVRDGRVERGEAFDVRRRRQAVAADLGQKIHVVVGLQALDVAHAVAEQPQPPLGADPRVEQAGCCRRRRFAVLAYSGFSRGLAAAR